MLLFLHVLACALWLGTAVTLPFWGNRMNRADHLHTVLAIIDTVFILKVVFIMGGLLATVATGALLMGQYGYLDLPLSLYPDWLTVSLSIVTVIFINSWIILFLLLAGRRGRRSWMRVVPPIGYTNIGLIAVVVFLMVVKPEAVLLRDSLVSSLGLILIANLINLGVKFLQRRQLLRMSPREFAETYFGLMNDEKMVDLLKLFRDDAKFNDPFATGPVKGILAIERFFQRLGDQFDHIKIRPRAVSGTKDDLLIEWEAQGVTQNGSMMEGLRGTNNMKRRNGKIARVDIDFQLDDLPQIQRVSV